MGANKPLRILAGILSVLILVPTVVWLGIYNSNAAAEFEAIYGQRNEEVRSMIYEYDRLFDLREIEKIKLSEAKKHGSSMCMLIFQSCDVLLYTNVYLAACKKYSARGIFTVTNEECVGMSGCITKAQCDELLKYGFSMAVGLPDRVLKKSFDIEAYLDEVESLLAKQGYAMPKIFVFARENYSKTIYDAVIARGFNAVAFNRADPKCALSDTALKEDGGVMHIPYFYTSKRTPIRSGFETSMKDGENLSISTGLAQNGMRGTTATRDTTVASLKDIIETIKSYNSYYRSYSTYRKEKLEAETVYREVVNTLAANVAEYDRKIDLLHRRILNVYADV